ncbi:carboxylesterase [Colletotrichum phormii]|uniref:Carboxylesterase n=1 Tax=Colletotrichum phormii TaxID=359342 RepID=A0AAI9ZFS8_9PEZI|nr:carboxylesterase [Colletotrichum phormii]KAK1623735.1 carboxylesterase [Colletotrichum phormii]
MASTAQDFDHPIIGQVKGQASDGVIQFLGLKYATLEHWFDNAKLVQYDGSGMNATRHGPQAISDPEGVKNEHMIIQKSLPTAEFPGLSGTECLNLNLTAPLNVGDSEQVPVLVFIHGGGFGTGSNWWPQYDTKRIVQRANKLGKPIIAININYRLGIPGFLTSEELRKEGFKSNQGHHDQRTALEWVGKYVSGFGGNPERVTVVGESAGGISASRLLYSEKALASQIIILGGSPPSLPPLDLGVAEQAYKGVLKASEAEDVSSSERIKILSRASPEELSSKIGRSLPFLPVLDEETAPFVPTFETASAGKLVPKTTSCKAVMVGYAPLDASIFGFMGLFQRKENIAASFTQIINAALSHHAGTAAQILQAYDINDTTNDDEAFIRVLQFASDIGFRAPAESFANSFHGDSYLLEFAEPNPWEGPFRGYSTHVLDVAFLFQNYNEHLGETQRKSAESFVTDIIDFVHGQAPWKRFQDAGGRVVYQDGTRAYKEAGASTARFDLLLELGEKIGLDTLLKGWEAFLISVTLFVLSYAVGITMAYTIESKSLGSTLRGVDLGTIAQFRGIPYGNIVSRFAEPEPIVALPQDLNCTEFGPRCPQVKVDVGHLLRIPPEHRLPVEAEDEFRCLNLDVTVPKSQELLTDQRLPVLVWIHGGSQAVTFGSAASGVCDTRRIVEDSVSSSKPVIVVTVQYRLNIFAFGSESSSSNLALKDQSLALRWVTDHVPDFGGDPNDVSLAGESAGAVYCHAHLAAGLRVRRVLLSSGSLYLSPPQPRPKASALRQTLLNHLGTLGDCDLSTAPVENLVKAMELAGIHSWFLQVDPSLVGWETAIGAAESVMIGDVQDEAVLWREGIWKMEASEIDQAFNYAGERQDTLKNLYNIHADRRSSSKIGALDFMNDYKFLLPAEKIARLFRAANKPAYRYLVDECNPWQPSNGAHHAVDLLFLFGGFDLSFAPGAQRTGKQMRKSVIEFLHSQEPWQLGSYAAFGPYGMFQELDSAGVKLRRRSEQAEFLHSVPSEILDKVFFALAAGRISLLN